MKRDHQSAFSAIMDGLHMPAFPIVTADMPVHGSPGMTLRDYFAAHASEIDIDEYRIYYHGGNRFTRSRAQARYLHADAMLAAREEV